jgi:hypothetical protein
LRCSRPRYDRAVSLARHWPLVLAAIACGNDQNPAVPDAPLVPVDGAAPALDAGFPAGSTNPARLWLAPINRSEINLQLLPDEPPHF